MESLKVQRCFSPLNKQAHEAGKFFKPKRNQQLNPQNQQSSKQQMCDMKVPKSFGVNTSSTYQISSIPIIISSNFQHQSNPLTQKQMDSNVKQMQTQQIYKDINQTNQHHRQRLNVKTPDLPNRFLNKEVSNKHNTGNFQIRKGTIKHQKARSSSQTTSKDFEIKTSSTQSILLSSGKLPSIKRIQANENYFKCMMNQDVNHEPVYKNKQNVYLRNRSLNKSTGQIVRKSSCYGRDSEEQSKLQKSRKNSPSFHISKLKLPTFRQQNIQQYQIQSNSKNYDILKKSRQQQFLSTNQVEYTPKLFQQSNQSRKNMVYKNSFLNNSNVEPDSILKIDIRTSLLKLKQSLIQNEQLHVSFELPQQFFQPPNSSTPSSELHHLMVSLFAQVGLNPQIVSIRKYMNCVVMKDKNLCIFWHFNGRIYFGGWSNKNSISDGNKNGIGMQWVPSRYVYFGEYKDNKKEGYGIMKKENKQVYVGCWKNNQRWGWGKIFDSSGNLHQNGQFIQGCFIYPKKQLNKGFQDA